MSPDPWPDPFSLNELAETSLIQLVEALQHCHGSGHGVIHLQGLWSQRSLAGFTEIDDILLISAHLLGSQSASSRWARAERTSGHAHLTDELDAPAAEAARWSNWPGRYSGKRHALGSRQLGVGVIHRRLAEHGADALVEQCLVNSPSHHGSSAGADRSGPLMPSRPGRFIFRPLASTSKPGFFT